ncbi:P-loop containing nucleoside triphosphate hydrolase protein, partial [Thamnocephalis sphaerospora]
APASRPPLTDEQPRETSVVVRIRPLLAEEQEAGIFPVTAVSGASVTLLEPRFTVKKRPAVNKHTFRADHVLPGGADVRTDTPPMGVTDEALYDCCARSLTELAMRGGVSTLFAFGQTGSGKTYTISHIQRQLATDNEATASAVCIEMFMSIFELCGDSANDLLNEHRPVQILEDVVGDIQVTGLREERLASVAQCQALFDEAAKFRRTASTERNASSSRSHAVARIRMENRAVSEAEPGLLTLIDLAGSERHQDSQHHDAARLAETRLVNASLMTLKDCMRHRALALGGNGAAGKGSGYVHIPFRRSRLTTLLKETFDLEARRPCRTCVIACVSPGVHDIAHSLNTLRYVAPIRVVRPANAARPPVDRRDPSTWSHKQFAKWLKATSHDCVSVDKLAPNQETGLQMVRLPEAEFMRRCLQCNGISEKKAKDLYVSFW